MNELTAKRAREFFHYDPESGIVTQKRTVSGRPRNQIVGCRTVINGITYLAIKIDRIKYMLHRVIWLMQTGVFPVQTDHENGDGTDNRWCNLRNVSVSGNAKNRKLAITNTSGITGVRWRLDKQRWIACIVSNGKNTSLYNGTDFFEACCRRKSAEIKYGFHKNHGCR